MIRIKRIGVKQTAKVVAVFYFLISLIFIIPVAVFTLIAGSMGGKNPGAFPTFGGLFILVLPVIYAVLGYIIIAITSVIYNFIAKKVGGIEIELDSNDIAQTAPPLTTTQTPEAAENINTVVTTTNP